MGSRAWLAAWSLAATVAAQSPNPDPHWGANAFPEARTGLRYSLSANRFTEFDGEGNTYGSTVGYSTGFQIGTLSWTDRHAADPHLTYTLSLGLGYSADQPTRALQNDFMHVLKNIAPVPIDDTHSAFEMVGGASATWWSDPVPRVPTHVHGGDWRTGWFGGASGSGGTLYQDVACHTGLYVQTPRLDLGITRGAVRVGVMARGSAQQPGAAFDEVSDYALLTQLEVAWVPDQLERQPWWLLGAPSLTFTATHDSGLFIDRDTGDPIDGAFLSLRAEWPGGFRVETWNDMFQGTDYGPTFGLMIGFDLTSVFGITPW